MQIPLSKEDLETFGEMFHKQVTAKEEEHLADHNAELGNEVAAKMHSHNAKLARESLESYLGEAGEDLRTAWSIVQLMPRKV